MRFTLLVTGTAGKRRLKSLAKFLDGPGTSVYYGPGQTYLPPQREADRSASAS